MSYFQITALFRTSSETCRSFPGGPVAENPSCNAGEVELKSQAMGQLSPRAAMIEPEGHD